MISPPVVVELEDVSKRFILRKDKTLKDRVLHPFRSKQHEEDFWALRGVDLQIEAGSTIGLIGPNGSGKSTLLKVIGGIIDSDSGLVKSRGRMAALIELGAGFHPDLTGRENIYLNAAILGMTRAETESRFDEIVAFSGIEQFIDTQVKFYSSGMYVRLAFSVAINCDPDVLLVDEVLAVGDEAFQQKCLTKIEDFQKEGRTIILVSHSMGQIASLCDRVLVLGGGQVRFDGGAQEAISVLRSGFGGVSQSDGLISVSVQTGGSPVGPSASITSAKSSVPDGVSLHPGETLVVEIGFNVPEPTKHWDLTVSLVNSLGYTVLTTAARAIGLEHVLVGGNQTIRIEFPNLSLGSGGYTVTSAFFDGKQREVCRAEAIAPFEVESGKHCIGPVYSATNAALVR